MSRVTSSFANRSVGALFFLYKSLCLTFLLLLLVKLILGDGSWINYFITLVIGCVPLAAVRYLPGRKRAT